MWLSYPQLESLGPVGELIVDEATGNAHEHTAIDEMKASAISLYEQHRDEIEAPFFKQETRYSCAPACGSTETRLALLRLTLQKLRFVQAESCRRISRGAMMALPLSRLGRDPACA